MSDININDIRKLDGNLLLVFRELVRTRRTTETARRLGLSQSAVSHTLTRLRGLFGDPLFIRKSHGLEPTSRAIELAPRIEQLIGTAAAALGADTQFDPARSDRRFRIAAAEYVTALIGGPLVETFTREAPGASFTVDYLLGETSLDSLRRGEVDLVLGQFIKLPPGVEATTLYSDRFCIVARKKHPRLKRRVDVRAFSRLPNIFVGRSGETGITDATLPSPRQVRTVALVPRWLTALTMVSTTDAVATCPRRFAERQAPVMGLQIIDADFAGPRFKVSAVRRLGEADPGISWLLDVIRAAAR